MFSKLRSFEDTGDTLFLTANIDWDVFLAMMGSGRKSQVTKIENVF